MSRPESVAVGGYYPTPTHLLPSIARLVDASYRSPERYSSPTYALFDPCAGEGEALFELAREWFGENLREISGARLEFYACELESTRAEALKTRWRKEIREWGETQGIEQGDAFRLIWKPGSHSNQGANVLYLNPPYDTHPIKGRLEQAFLERFTPALIPGEGILLFVVPYYALLASAVYLATHYSALWCFRFPSPDFEVFKQVVLVGKRASSPAPLGAEESSLAAQVRQWAEDPTSISELPAGPVVRLPPKSSGGLEDFKIAPLDLTSLRAAVRPWWGNLGGKGEAGPVRGIGVDGELSDLFGRPAPVAMPPRPAHIAQALAAGLFNGVRVSPGAGAGLPPVLVKGVFDREYKTTEEKKDKEGNVKALVQVQQPVLRVSVLDLEQGTFHELSKGVEPSGSTDLENFSVADLVVSYRGDLLRVMGEQCPPLHDPRDPKGQVALPPLTRKLFWAQNQAVQGALKLLATGENPFILGEIGSGKSTLACTILEALSPQRLSSTLSQIRALGIAGSLRPVERALILCPPHLRQSWEDQVRAVIPGARVVHLERISDLEKVAAPRGEEAPQKGELPLFAAARRNQPGRGLTIAILSRETAKLGHAWVDGVDEKRPRCPRCGLRAPEGELAKKRIRCSHVFWRPADPIATITVDLAHLLAPVYPADPQIWALSRARHLAAWGRKKSPGWGKVALGERLTKSPLGSLIAKLAALPARKELAVIITKLLFSAQDMDRDAVILTTAEKLFDGLLSCPEYDPWGPLVDLLLTVGDAGSEAQLATIERLKARAREAGKTSYYNDPWTYAPANAEQLREEHQGTTGERPVYVGQKYLRGSPVLGLTWDGKPLGDVSFALEAFKELVALGKFRQSEPCDEPLYQAVPEPRRYPLATFIARRCPRLFDFLVIDEGHEYSGEGTAQERAAHRLTELGQPTILLTGSVMNGYSSSLFQNMVALSPRFRSEFSREDRSNFVQRYGYRKQLVEVGKGEGKFRERGAVTDRIEADFEKTRQLGEAPGVLPLFVLRHLLPVAVTLHKEDLAQDLPPCTELQIPLLLDVAGETGIGAELLRRYKKLQGAVLEQIKRDRFDPDYAGKLWGALGGLPSYLDRCHTDTGNEGEGEGRLFTVRYPEALDRKLVAEAACFPAGELSPKETWLVNKLRAEFAEGRNVLIFVWHTSPESGLVKRLARVIREQTGEEAAALDVAKVSTKVRQEWIDRELVKKKRRVLLVNPVAVQTGLNNLVYCATAVWYENPACNAIVYRQANGRLDRIGQTKPVRIYSPVYTGTAQELAHQLLLRKVAVSLQTDGLSAESALQAAGAGDEKEKAFDSMDFGRALYELLTEGKRGVA